MPEPTVLLLSTSDTDLISARSSGKNYRWANPSRLSDLELTDLLAEASIVVIRILGGYRAWQSGIDTVIAGGVPAVLVSGEQAETADPRRVWCPHPTPVADCLRRTVDERDSTARPRCNSLLPLIRVVTCLDCVDEGSDAGERARRDDAPIADIPHFVGADAD